MIEVGTSLTRAPADAPGAGDVRRRRGDVWRRLVTSGAPAGTSGARRGLLLRAYLAITGVAMLVAFINVMTQLDDARRFGRALSPAAVASWELSSAAAMLLASAVIYWTVRLAPVRRGRLAATLAIHAGASIVFSALHVGVMVLIRTALYAAAGSRYDFALSQWPYEYRKDLLTYIALAGVFWAAARLARGAEPAPQAASPAVPTFDIQDGGSIYRVTVREILAVRAAGNYVEFVLEDDRRPLMRASMARIEAVLAPHGLVRTHRSWLVNVGRVRALCPAGSGDFRLDLRGGLAVPVSRRYPAALARLRADRQTGEG
jgi:DNA-binding LytR/AlgR family response regulator